MDAIFNGVVLANTKKATGWAVGVLNTERNQHSEEKCPPNC